MKKLLAIVLAAVLAVSVLSACGGSSPAPAAQGGNETTKAEETTTVSADSNVGNQEADIKEDNGSVESQLAGMVTKSAPGEYFGDLITIAANNGPNSFDPFARGAGYGANINIFESLGYADREGNLRLGLLKSIEKKDDLTYECELWDFITDTAGHNLKASDVKWSIDTFIANGNQGGVAKLDNIEVTGDYTFIWHNSAPFGVGELEKQFSNPKILVQEAYESDPDHMAANPVGTGPYKLKEFMEGSYGIFEANEDYWFNKIDDEAWLAENDYIWSYQNYKEIRVDVISDGSARAIALENGAVDACTSLNTADVANYAGNPDFTTIDLPVSPPVSYYFNLTENSPCADVNLRKAICYAIDNAGVAAGLDVPAFPVYGLQPRMFDAPEEWKTGREYYDYNVEKAKECLAESSYNGETLVVLFEDGDQRVPSWVLMQAMLNEVGINIEMKVAERSVINELHYDFTAWDIMSDTMGGGSYLPNVLKKFWSQDVFKDLQGKNVCGVEDPELDRLYEDVLNVHDDASIEAWDQYFTFDACIGYAICNFNNQTVCSSKYIPATAGSQNQLCPGAFTPAE